MSDPTLQNINIVKLKPVQACFDGIEDVLEKIQPLLDIIMR